MYIFIVNDLKHFNYGKRKEYRSTKCSYPPLKSIVVNGKKKIAVNGVVNLNLNNLKGGVQPDWNQNDATKPDYIKNRICYDEPTTTLYDSEIFLHLTYSASGSFFTKSDVDLSKSYTLTVNETVFPLTIVAFQGGFDSFSFRDIPQSLSILFRPNRISLNVVDTNEVTLLLSSTDGDVLFSDTVQLRADSGECTLEDVIDFIEGESYSITIDGNTFESVAVDTDGELCVEIQSPIGVFVFVTYYNDGDSITECLVYTDDYLNHTYSLKIQHSSVHPIADKYIPQLGGVQFMVDDGDLRVSLDGGVSWKFVEVYDK